MSKLYMMVGLPGSGKSQKAKELGVKVFSSDNLRKELWGDENIQGDNNQLFTELRSRIKDCLQNGEDCVFDATNIKSKKRTAFLNELRKINCEKICVFMATDFRVCLGRNESRDRKVPYDVIKRMYLQIEVPQYREGWDKIEIIRTRDSKNNYNLFELIDNLEKINHDNPNHMLTIGGHIQAVTKWIIDNYKLKFAGDINRLELLLRAAINHDIGKGFVKGFYDFKGNPTEIAHYYGHENVSSYMYIMYETDESLNDLDKVLYVADLIGLHMKMHANGQDRDKAFKKILELVGKREFEDLCILNEADTMCG